MGLNQTSSKLPNRLGQNQDGQKWIGPNWIGHNWSNQDGQNGIGQSRSLPSHSRDRHSTRNRERQNKPHSRNHITHSKRSTKIQDIRWQSIEPQSQSSRHSAQRAHICHVNEEFNGDSNAKAQEAYPLLAWHE